MISVNRYAFTHVYGFERKCTKDNFLKTLSCVPVISILAGIIMLCNRNKRVTNNIPECYRAYKARMVINLTGLGSVQIPLFIVATIMKYSGDSRHFRS